MIPNDSLSPEVVYFLKVNGALALFYLLYRLFFYTDTFFKLRRFLLLAFFGLAFLYPLMNFQEWVREQPPMAKAIHLYASILLPETTIIATPAKIDWLHRVSIGWMIVYLGGVIFLVVRFLFQLNGIFRLARSSRKVEIQGVRVHLLTEPAGPFSFFGMIFLYPATHSSTQMAEILAHEETHVSQWHSIDVVIGELASIFCWINPFVWWLKRELRYNLEYLADHTVIQSGYDSKSYQYHLVGLAHHYPAVANLYTHFQVSPLKNRIRMMNQKRSGNISRIKYLVFLPLTALLMVFSNMETLARITSRPVTHPSPVDTALSAGPQNSLASPLHIQVKARVVDEAARPLPAVAVTVAGSSIGTLTNENGDFSFEIPIDGILRFTYPGKAEQAIPAKAISKYKEIMLVSQQSFSSGQREPIIESAEDPSDPIYKLVDPMPCFPGGDRALLQYVAEHVKYPKDAEQAKMQGRVICEFVIGKDGKVVDAKVLKGVYASLDAEALRVIRSFPDWTPGFVDGQPVRVKFAVPITFRLQ